MASIFSRQMEVIVYLLGATAEYPGEIEARGGGGSGLASTSGRQVSLGLGA